jgi:hypothetical protein
MSLRREQDPRTLGLIYMYKPSTEQFSILECVSLEVLHIL